VNLFRAILYEYMHVSTYCACKMNSLLTEWERDGREGGREDVIDRNEKN